MPTERTDRLCDLALLWEERRSLGDLVSAEELCCDEPELLAPLRDRIAKLERMNALLGPETIDLAVTTAGTASNLDRPVAAAQLAGETLTAQMSYRIVRPHAKGGLGEVLLAEDERLGRPVALKRIRESFERDPERRQRFLREAEITSRLEHPGIVPVHGVCEDEAGRPCYAMRFIEGETLLAAIQEFHAEDTLGRDPGERRLALRQLLTRFVAACNTVAYAHSRGIIHRDLKPANIMLGPYGETLVVDWGLAKSCLVVPRQDQPNASLTSDEITSSTARSVFLSRSDRATSSDSNLTQTGAALGTPAFMSPEQAAGRLDELGPASDIYSLGATLFALLAGKAPFEGLELGALFDRLERGAIPTARSINSVVPKPLDAICRKAMARDLHQRYSTAIELAEDIEHWLADEPVTAYREPLIARASRFTRRHRVAVTAAVVTTLGLAFASSLILTAIAERQLSVLTRDIEVGLKGTDWSESHLAHMDSLVERLARKAPEQAAAERDRINRRFAEVLRAELQQPRLESDSVARLEDQLQRMADRDTEQAATLRALFQRRLRDWQPIVELNRPFNNLKEVFGTSVFRTESGGLVPDFKPAMHLQGVPVYRTALASAGHVRLRAEFEIPTGTRPAFGLVLNCVAEVQRVIRPIDGREQRKLIGYTVLVRDLDLLDAKSEASSDIAEADVLQSSAASVRPVVIQLFRNDVLLCEERSTLPASPVVLTFSREGDRFTAQLGDHPPMVFSDPFPLVNQSTARCGIAMSKEVRLAQLVRFRQSMPVLASSLEQADELFAQLKYDEAAKLYQSAIPAASGEAELEARYKLGVCSLHLNRTDEAIETLESLAAESLGRWPLLASCQLWTLRAKAGQLEAADAIQDSINTRYRVRDLYATVPVELRDDILKSYQSWGVHYFLYNPERIRNLERAHTATKLLGQTPNERVRTSLIRAYRLIGDEEKALELATESLQISTTAAGAFAVTHLEDVCWMLRRRGETAKALKEVDRRLATAPHTSARGLLYHVLIVEKARGLIALGQWDTAEKLLTEMMNANAVNHVNSHALSSACLMLGSLRDRRGDAEGAKQAWQKGLIKNWDAPHPGVPASYRFPSTGVNILLSQLIMASLCGELDDSLAEQIHKRLTSTLSENPQTAQFVASLGTPAKEYRKMWLTPRGREWADRIAFRDLSFADYIHIPVLLTMHQGLRDLTFAAEPTVEQDELLWTFCRDLHAAYSRGEVGMAEILQLVLTWKGTTNALGWAGVAPKLSKPLRAEAAYFAGVRYQRLRRRSDSDQFWKSAQSDAEANSDIARLIRMTLDQNAQP